MSNLQILTQKLKSKTANSDAIYTEMYRLASTNFNRRLFDLSDHLDKFNEIIDKPQTLYFLDDMIEFFVSNMALVDRYKNTRSYLTFLSHITRAVSTVLYEKEAFIKGIEYVAKLTDILRRKYPHIETYLAEYSQKLNNMKNFVEYSSDVKKSISEIKPSEFINERSYKPIQSVSIDLKLTAKIETIIYKLLLQVQQDFIKRNPLNISSEYSDLNGMVMGKEISNATSDLVSITQMLENFSANSDTAVSVAIDAASSIRLHNPLVVVYKNGVSTEMKKFHAKLPSDITLLAAGVNVDGLSTCDVNGHSKTGTNDIPVAGEKLRKIIDNYRVFFDNYYNTYIDLCKAAQSLDTLLSRFTKNIRKDTGLYKQITTHLQSAKTYNQVHRNKDFNVEELLTDIFDPSGAFKVTRNQQIANPLMTLNPQIDLLFNRQQDQTGTNHVRDTRETSDKRYSPQSKMTRIAEYYNYDYIMKSILSIFETLVAFSDDDYAEAGSTFTGIRAAIENYASRGIFKLDTIGLTACDIKKGTFNILDTNVRVGLTHVNDIDSNTFAANQATIHSKGHYIMQNMVKAIVAKTMVALGVFNVNDYTNNKPFKINMFDTTRVMVGGNSIENQTIIPDATELYIRLPLMVEFYKSIFRIPPGSPNNVTLGIQTPEPFGDLIRVIFNRSDNLNFIEYSTQEMMRVIEYVNTLYKRYKPDADREGMSITRYIVYKLIDVVNKTYGVLDRYEYGKMIQAASEYIDLDQELLANFDVYDDIEERTEKNIKLEKLPSDAYTKVSKTDEISILKNSALLNASSNMNILKRFRKKIYAFLLDNKSDDRFNAQYDTVNSIFSLKEMMRQIKDDVDKASTNETKFGIIYKLLNGSKTLQTPEAIKYTLMFDFIYTLGNVVNEGLTFIEKIRNRFSNEILPDDCEFDTVAFDESIPVDNVPGADAILTQRMGARSRRDKVAKLAMVGAMPGISNFFALGLADYGSVLETMEISAPIPVFNPTNPNEVIVGDQWIQYLAALSNSNKLNYDNNAAKGNSSNCVQQVVHALLDLDPSLFNNGQNVSEFHKLLRVFYQPHNIDNLGYNYPNVNLNFNPDILAALSSPLYKYYNNIKFREQMANMIQQDTFKLLRKALMHPHMFKFSMETGDISLSIDEAKGNLDEALRSIEAIAQDLTITSSNRQHDIFKHNEKYIRHLRQRYNILFVDPSQSDTVRSSLRNLKAFLTGNVEEHKTIITKVSDSLFRGFDPVVTQNNIIGVVNELNAASVLPADKFKSVVEEAVKDKAAKNIKSLSKKFWRSFSNRWGGGKNVSLSHYKMANSFNVDNNNAMYPLEYKPFDIEFFVKKHTDGSNSIDYNDVIYAEPHPEAFTTSGLFNFDLVSYFNNILNVWLKSCIGTDKKIYAPCLNLGLDNAAVIDNNLSNFESLSFLPTGINFSDITSTQYSNYTNPIYFDHREMFDSIKHYCHDITIQPHSLNYEFVPAESDAEALAFNLPVVLFNINNSTSAALPENANRNRSYFKNVNSLTRTLLFPSNFGVVSNILPVQIAPNGIFDIVDETPMNTNPGNTGVGFFTRAKSRMVNSKLEHINLTSRHFTDINTMFSIGNQRDVLNSSIQSLISICDLGEQTNDLKLNAAKYYLYSQQLSNSAAPPLVNDFTSMVLDNEITKQAAAYWGYHSVSLQANTRSWENYSANLSLWSNAMKVLLNNRLDMQENIPVGTAQKVHTTINPSADINYFGVKLKYGDDNGTGRGILLKSIKTVIDTLKTSMDRGGKKTYLWESISDISNDRMSTVYNIKGAITYVKHHMRILKNMVNTVTMVSQRDNTILNDDEVSILIDLNSRCKNILDSMNTLSREMDIQMSSPINYGSKEYSSRDNSSRDFARDDENMILSSNMFNFLSDGALYPCSVKDYNNKMQLSNDHTKGNMSFSTMHKLFPSVFISKTFLPNILNRVFPTLPNIPAANRQVPIAVTTPPAGNLRVPIPVRIPPYPIALLAEPYSQMFGGAAPVANINFNLTTRGAPVHVGRQIPGSISRKFNYNEDKYDKYVKDHNYTKIVPDPSEVTTITNTTLAHIANGLSTALTNANVGSKTFITGLGELEYVSTINYSNLVNMINAYYSKLGEYKNASSYRRFTRGVAQHRSLNIGNSNYSDYRSGATEPLVKVMKQGNMYIRSPNPGSVGGGKFDKTTLFELVNTINESGRSVSEFVELNTYLNNLHNKLSTACDDYPFIGKSMNISGMFSYLKSSKLNIQDNSELRQVVNATEAKFNSEPFSVTPTVDDSWNTQPRLAHMHFHEVLVPILVDDDPARQVNDVAYYVNFATPFDAVAELYPMYEGYYASYCGPVFRNQDFGDIRIEAENKAKTYPENLNVFNRMEYGIHVPLVKNMSNDWNRIYNSYAKMFASCKVMYDKLNADPGSNYSISLEQFPYLKSLIGSYSASVNGSNNKDLYAVALNAVAMCKLHPEESACGLQKNISLNNDSPIEVNKELKDSFLYDIIPFDEVNSVFKLFNKNNYLQSTSDDKITFLNYIYALIDNRIDINKINAPIGNIIFDKESLLKLNILDLGVMPIDVYAMTREIPLAFVYNYACALDDYLLEHTGGTYLNKDIIESRYLGFAKDTDSKIRQGLGAAIRNLDNEYPPQMEYIVHPYKNEWGRFAKQLINNPNNLLGRVGFDSKLITNIKFNAMFMFLNDIYLAMHTNNQTNSTIVADSGNNGVFRHYSTKNANDIEISRNAFATPGTVTATAAFDSMPFNIFTSFTPARVGSGHKIAVDSSVDMVKKFNIIPLVPTIAGSTLDFNPPMDNLKSMALAMCGGVDNDDAIIQYEEVGIVKIIESRIDKLYAHVKPHVLPEYSTGIIEAQYQFAIYDGNNLTEESLPGLGLNMYDPNTIGDRDEVTRTKVQQLAVLSKVLYTPQGFSYTFTRNILACNFWYNALRYNITETFTHNSKTVMISDRQLLRPINNL